MYYYVIKSKDFLIKHIVMYNNLLLSAHLQTTTEEQVQKRNELRI